MYIYVNVSLDSMQYVAEVRAYSYHQCRPGIDGFGDIDFRVTFSL